MVSPDTTNATRTPSGSKEAEDLNERDFKKNDQQENNRISMIYPRSVPNLLCLNSWVNMNSWEFMGERKSLWETEH